MHSGANPHCKRSPIRIGAQDDALDRRKSDNSDTNSGRTQTQQRAQGVERQFGLMSTVPDFEAMTAAQRVLSPSGDELQVVGEMESGNPGIVAFDRSGAIKRVGEVVPPDPGEAAMN